jgi:type IV pilus assembly protein PilP
MLRDLRLILALTAAIYGLNAQAQAPQPPVSPPPPPQAPQNPQQVPGQPLATPPAAPAPPPPQNPEISSFLKPFDYDPRGRRDPFEPPYIDKPQAEGAVHGPFLPLQQFDLTQLKLTGIIWDVKHPKAMIVDPQGKVHIVGPNTKVGKNNGYIAAIREGEIVVVETTEEDGRLLSSPRIVKLLSK